MNPHTQALLDEVRAPKHARKKDVDLAIVALIPTLAKVSQEAAEIQLLAQLAEVAEDDPEVRGRLDQYVRKATSLQRLCREIEKSTRDLLTCFRNLQDADTEIRAKAKDAGYTV